MSTDRLVLAEVLERIAGFLELRGENPFRVRAFQNAARALRGLPGSASEALADGSLAATRGIGPATLAIIHEVLASGRSSYLDQLEGETPAGLLQLLGVPGLGPARLRQLHAALGLDSLEALESAARDGSLARQPGFGPRTVEKIVKGIAFARGRHTLRLFPAAAGEAEALRAALAALPGVDRVMVAGAVRRRTELVGGLDLAAAAARTAAELREPLGALPGLDAVRLAGPGAVSFRAPGGVPVTLRVAPPVQFGAALLQATGSDAHLAALAAWAASTGWTVGPEGITRDGALLPAPDESACYAALGLAPIPPELREGLDEVTRAAAGTLPALVEREQLAGLLHCHTTWSDGSQSSAELAAGARAAGYAWLGITDHSRAAAYAGGLTLERVRLQWTELDALGASAGIRILKGIECDILADGALDYDDDTLAGFDFVIGSIHSRQGLGQAEMTARLLRALDHPALTILGHPTGRLLLSRAAYPLDLEQLFARAAANGVALELNGDPHRLDLDWRLVRQAHRLGVTFSLGADAHAPADLRYVDYALAMARKAGLEARDLLNTRSADEFLAFARARRKTGP